jgi:uncharacterized protein
MADKSSSASEMTRRGFVRQGLCTAVILTAVDAIGYGAESQQSRSDHRPALADRRFRSAAVEEFLVRVSSQIGEPVLRAMFLNCFPNTLDTTVIPGEFEGKPDTAVVTGDIAAMWLRDSSAQVWPYLPFAAKDPALRNLLEGVVRRQTRCLLIDPYANAFMADLSAPPLKWSLQDHTTMKQGVGERKYELDSLCYPLRLAYGYWKATGDSTPFDEQWRAAMTLVVDTMRVQQRRNGEGPYLFQREAENPTDSLVNGIGNPGKPVGLIASCFRPSDDACILPFLIPSNLFAVTSLRHLAEMASTVLHDSALAGRAISLADEVMVALRRHGIANTKNGTIWAYEVDGFGGQILMDDANVPSLLGLPYLDSSPDADLYARTRAFVWSSANPWFFHGTAGEGVGGPHIGRGSVWPMSQIIYALTSTSELEIARMLLMLKSGSAGTGFVHESYNMDNPQIFTRPWFAWANTLFGELIAHLVVRSPGLLRD